MKHRTLYFKYYLEGALEYNKINGSLNTEKK
jgi:hypothetical protein